MREPQSIWPRVASYTLPIGGVVAFALMAMQSYALKGGPAGVLIANMACSLGAAACLFAARVRLTARSNRCAEDPNMPELDAWRTQASTAVWAFASPLFMVVCWCIQVWAIGHFRHGSMLAQRQPVATIIAGIIFALAITPVMCELFRLGESRMPDLGDPLAIDVDAQAKYDLPF